MTAQTTSSQNTRSNFLRRVLQANGLFSGLSGLLFMVEAGPIAAFLGLSAPVILVITGVLLLLYAAALFYTAAQATIPRREVLAFVILDAAWVAGSLAILLAGWPALSGGGKWAVAIVADVVAVFAALQYYAVRRR